MPRSNDPEIRGSGTGAKGRAVAPGPVKPVESMTMSGGYTTIKPGAGSLTQPGAKTGIKSGPVGTASFTPGMVKTKAALTPNSRGYRAPK